MPDALQLLRHGDVLTQHATGHQRLGAGLLDLQDLRRKVRLALLVDLAGDHLQLLLLGRALETVAHVLPVVVVLRDQRPLLVRVTLRHLGHQLVDRFAHVVPDREHVLDGGLVQAFVGGDGRHRRNAGLLDQRHGGLRLRGARDGGEGEDLVAVDQLAHTLDGA